MLIEELSKEIKEKADTMLSYDGGVSISKEFDEWFSEAIQNIEFGDAISCANYDYALMQVSNNVAHLCIFSLKEGLERISNENHIGIHDEYFKDAIKNYTVRETVGEEIQITARTWEEEYYLIREYFKTYGRICKEVAKPMNAYNSDICSITTGEDNENGELTVTIIDGTNNEIAYTFKDVLESPKILDSRRKFKLKYGILTALVGIATIVVTGILLYFLYK